MIRLNQTEPLALLIVHGNEDACRSLARRFHRQGYQVATAGNPDEAIGLARQGSFDAAVVDGGQFGDADLQLLKQLKAEADCEVIRAVVASPRWASLFRRTPF
jgi:ActR/RegA family two-component response regulator